MMRPLLTALLATTALPAFADSFQLDTDVTRALITGDGGVVTYTAPVNLPAGTHTLVSYLPTLGYENTVLDFRFPETTGIRVLAQTSTTDHAAPIRREPTAELQAAKTALETARAAQRAFQQSIETKRAEQTAAEFQLQLIQTTAKTGFGTPDTGLQADQFTAVAAAIAATALSAQQTIATVKTELAALQPQAERLAQDVEFAQSTVNRLEPEGYITLQQVKTTLAVPTAQNVTIEIDNLEQAYWQPQYIAELAQDGAKGTLQLHRTATVQIGEPGYRPLDEWDDVEITLSTANLSERATTFIPAPQLKRLIDEAKLRKSISARSSYGSVADESMETMPMAEPVVALEVGGTSFAGQTVLFNLGTGHSINWSAATTTFNIDTLTMPVDLYAMANAARDTTPFLYTDLKNDTGGILLAGETQIHRDGTLIGRTYLPQLFPGQTEPVGLGPLYGIRLQRDTLSVEEGDSGFISSKSEINRSYRTTITSALSYDMPFKLLDVIPTSEDEDLVIRMSARPTPTEPNRDGKRGVLVWDVDLGKNSSTTVSFGYQMKWPTGKVPFPN